MSRQFQFLPIATVTVDDQGNATLELDWSSSSQGEWDEATCDHVPTQATELVCTLLDAYVHTLPVTAIGKVDLTEGSR